MTRQEFIDDVTSWSELIEFCGDNGCYCCEDVYDEYDRDSYINENLVDMARNADNWESLKETLEDITTGYDYYRRDDGGEWYGLDDSDFDDYKDDVLEWADDHDVFEDEEEEDPDDYFCEDDEDDDFVAPEEPMSIGELLGACSSQLTNINNASREAEAEEAAKFELFVAGRVTITKGE